jgi:hypothetical protein
MDGTHHGDHENNVIPCSTRREAVKRRRKVKIPTIVTQLNIGSESSIPKYETDVEDDVDNKFLIATE